MGHPMCNYWYRRIRLCEMPFANGTTKSLSLNVVRMAPLHEFWSIRLRSAWLLPSGLLCWDTHYQQFSAALVTYS